jgi:dinuclear metal center YbgI/SA1388 family protein
MRLHGLADLLESLAPASLAADWDNSGWQIRLEDADLQGVLIGLDAVPATVDEAARVGANLLVTHHPLFLRPPRSLRADGLPGATSLQAVRQGVSIFSLHTNLDAAPHGTSQALAAALELPPGEPLEKRADGRGGYGLLTSADRARPLLAWSALVAERLGRPPLALSGNPEALHQVVAVMGGSGASLIGCAVAAGASLLITADVRYHEAQAAQASGLSLLVLDHFDSEWPVLATIADFLRARLTCPISVSNSRSTPWEVLVR